MHFKSPNHLNMFFFNLIELLATMLQVDEKKRPDFNQLQMMFNLY